MEKLIKSKNPNLYFGAGIMSFDDFNYNMFNERMLNILQTQNSDSSEEEFNFNAILN